MPITMYFVLKYPQFSKISIIHLIFLKLLVLVEMASFKSFNDSYIQNFFKKSSKNTYGKYVDENR